MARSVTTSRRNRALIAEYEAGQPIDQLAQKYKLSHKRVRAIIADEQNRRFVSTDPFYRRFRAKIGST